jgi:hypothetical protein
MPLFYHCDQCNRKYKTQVKYRKHVHNSHGVPEDEIQVPVAVEFSSSHNRQRAPAAPRLPPVPFQQPMMLIDPLPPPLPPPRLPPPPLPSIRPRVAPPPPEPQPFLPVQVPWRVERHYDPRNYQVQPEQKEENKADEGENQEENLCKVCYEAQVNAAFVPCGHHITCHGCAQRVHTRGDRCPMCRGRVQSVLRVFS